MNTIVLPKTEGYPVHWEVTFEDGSSFDASQGTWDAFSDCREVDGEALYLSRMPLRKISVFHDDKVYTLESPDMARMCFGFHRWGANMLMAANSCLEPLWIYSAFGFIRDEERVILQVTSDGCRTLLQSRNQPFYF